MNTIRTYNVLRRDYMTLKRQKEMIKEYWKHRLVTSPVLCKDDKRYITFNVRI